VTKTKDTEKSPDIASEAELRKSGDFWYFLVFSLKKPKDIYNYTIVTLQIKREF